jgi:hypothetical protein
MSIKWDCQDNIVFFFLVEHKSILSSFLGISRLGMAVLHTLLLSPH